MYLLIAAAVFLLLAIQLYPLFFLIRYENGLRLYWLPRVFLGFGKARRLLKARPERAVHEVEIKTHLPLKVIWEWLKALWPKGKVWDWYFYGAPGQGFQAECIVSLSAGHIIVIAIKMRRRNHNGRRA